MKEIKEAVEFLSKLEMTSSVPQIRTLLDLAEKYLAVEGKMPQEYKHECSPACKATVTCIHGQRNKAIRECTLAFTAIRTELNRRLDGLKKEEWCVRKEEDFQTVAYVDGYNSAIEEMKEII